MTDHVLGLHHVTAIADDPRQNIAFYTGVLGLRLVKVTVDVGDPGAYKLYCSSDVGQPGTLLAFYCWPGACRGRSGTGQVSATLLAVPPGSLDAWRQRLVAYGVPTQGPFPGPRAEAEAEWLSLSDPDGLTLELVAQPAMAAPPAGTGGALAADQAIRGLYGIRLWEESSEATEAFLTKGLGLQLLDRSSHTACYSLEGMPTAVQVQVRKGPGVGRGLSVVGYVHHVAFRVRYEEDLNDYRERLIAYAATVSSIQDYVYYQAIRVKEPGGVRFELATDDPGVTLDESSEQLGMRLMLPRWLESRRAEIQHALPALKLPRGLMKYE